MSFFCDFCKKTFASKSNLTLHQKTAKYCLKLQGKNEEDIPSHMCEFCKKSFTTSYNFQEHISTCKKKHQFEQENMVKLYEKEILKHKKSEEKLRKEYEEKIDKYEDKLEKQKREYEDKLEKQKREYEEKMEKQKQDYDNRWDKQQDMIGTLAMKPSTTTKNVINNHQRILNFNDRDRLNDIIKNNVNQSIVKKGQIGLAGVVFEKYLKDEQGNQLYRVADASRQNFEYFDEEGELRIDIGEKKLTDAIAQSNLTKHVSAIAKDLPNLYDKDTGNLDSVIQLTDFEKDNSKFRKEMVRLSKK